MLGESHLGKLIVNDGNILYDLTWYLMDILLGEPHLGKLIADDGNNLYDLTYSLMGVLLRESQLGKLIANDGNIFLNKDLVGPKKHIDVASGKYQIDTITYIAMFNHAVILFSVQQ